MRNLKRAVLIAAAFVAFTILTQESVAVATMPIVSWINPDAEVDLSHIDDLRKK